MELVSQKFELQSTFFGEAYLAVSRALQEEVGGLYGEMASYVQSDNPELALKIVFGVCCGIYMAKSSSSDVDRSFYGLTIIDHEMFDIRIRFAALKALASFVPSGSFLVFRNPDRNQEPVYWRYIYTGSHLIKQSGHMEVGWEEIPERFWKGHTPDQLQP